MLAVPPVKGLVRLGWLAAIGVGILAAALSLLRILATNPSALTTLVWAEDGLFALCARKAGALECLAEPFAGYLPFTPKAIGVMVATLPLEQWALATNLLAAALAGACAAVTFAVLARQRFSVLASALVALLVVAAPISGFEIVNSYANVNQPILFTATIAVAFPIRGRWALAGYCAGLLLAALTIPTAAVLLLVVGFQVLRGQVGRRGGVAMAVALLAGMAAQVMAAVTADQHRSLNLSIAAVEEWARAIPSALATLVPGLTFGTQTDFTGALFPASALTEWFVVAPLALLSLWLLARGRNPRAWGFGVLLGVGLSVSLLSSVALGVNNRYYIAPTLLTAAAGLLALDDWLARKAEASGARRLPLLAMSLVAVVLIGAWWSSLPASVYRADSLRPPWTQMVDDVSRACAAAPDAVIVVRFSPAGWSGGPEGWLAGRGVEPLIPRATCAQLAD